MEQRELKLSYRAYSNTGQLPESDAQLVAEAKAALDNAYAPYSNFKVAAIILLANGKTVTGTNQENAAFPAGTCAEGIALGAASSLYPNVAIKKIAITVKSGSHVVSSPTAPCGICRQRILEYENRFNSPIEIILTGEEGEVFAINSVKDILPLNFSKADL